ncbi:Peptidoglycan/xylan/chitin deacetylase, PgdA/CDA1 family [Streptomyces sp. 2224.1]|uniref:polysaccharide deacetylase family protein n=1 Tax=unclassified Streptomyces TaxID=2593676 RepID=UPI000883ED44|nr:MULTISPECIES: polysaccharide deacetylase family protein [unclassified Streptomyces]PBC83555.1 peptidoglycan/xylan/chitin deacetylase (PgdA/CDA1 family) [Streptomyces sp. 2321.6]SDR41214.1 Peptidoglycan/xylan/chitin deacetylase, PgdA/CDA1 family [Streptomyces sp. KS_16]SEC02726.1 Peptidoglycan/xylan/chitin deacetylase, PgdA/CDA1 family [Streptomyces sp. 2224.1]SED00439.1 Peptidoglycan/xylan/chitin deacetylase, PgdA/CDA1 family [Streptomyces sp. 2133.1]SNC69633.1 Peptidoglycan/xylan/chitin de
MPKQMSTARRTSIAGLPAVTALALALSGCATYDVTAPADARADAPAADVKAKDARLAAAGDAKNAGGKNGSGDDVDCRTAKCVALTFDAGPSENTNRLLDILKKEKVHATFFMLGRNHVDKRPAEVKRIDAEGHEPANHTWSHQILTDIEPKEATRELSRVQDAVRKITGKTPKLMRPPQGRTDGEVSEISKRLGLAQVLWSVTAKDYRTNDSALITKRVLDQTERDGIILLHDIYKGTVPAVPGILKELKKRGYTVVTVSQLLSPAKPEPGMVYRP